MVGVNGWKSEVAVGGEVRRVDTGDLVSDGECRRIRATWRSRRGRGYWREARGCSDGGAWRGNYTCAPCGRSDHTSYSKPGRSTGLCVDRRRGT